MPVKGKEGVRTFFLLVDGGEKTGHEDFSAAPGWFGNAGGGGVWGEVLHCEEGLLMIVNSDSTTR